MQYRKFGKLDYEVSALGLGCMRLPRIVEENSSRVDREKAYELIRYAADHGVNYFDTAYSYHAKDSEAVLGEALEGGYRQRVKIATKQPFGVMHTQKDIRINLENTLKKLRTDYIDLYLVHCITADSWSAIKEREILKEYEKFRDEGLIKAIAFSYHGEYQGFHDILTQYSWDMCQVQQNLLDVDKEVTAKSIELAGERDIPVVVMEPLRGGGLATATAAVQEIYDTYPGGRKPVEWAFRHLLDYPQVSCILSGMTTMEQLKENIEIFSKTDTQSGCLSDQEKDILKKVKAAYESVVTIPCTGCEYCLPCPSGVGIPAIFSRYNAGMMFENFDQPKRSYMFMRNGGSDVSKCVECGACEPQCPQNIPIIEQLKVAHKALDGWYE